MSCRRKQSVAAVVKQVNKHQQGNIVIMNIKHILAATALGIASMSSYALTGPITLVDGSASFGNSVNRNTSFTDTFTFVLNTAAVDFSSLVSTITTKTKDIDFSTVTLSGGSLPVTSFTQTSFDPAKPGNGTEMWQLDLAGPLQAGSYSLVFSGKNVGTQTASYSGTVEVSPVPEPGTGALILAGLSAVMFVARRRRPDQN
jgi:hypothetical protein